MIVSEPALSLDFDACYRAASGRDTRWDGRVYLCVTSTGIYCRPSCPARKPKPENCRFFPSAAACVAVGFRACKRCRPDALPGTRDWDVRGDLVARAVRRIRDGAVDRIGVAGLAAELSVSERHLRRMLLEEVGATPLQLARSRRAHAARSLIEQTDLPLADIAFAAGFGSLRQFGDTMVQEFGVAPSRLARGGGLTGVGPRDGGGAGGARSGNVRSGNLDEAEPSSDERPALRLRLRTRAPYDASGCRAFFAAHAVPGRDRVDSTGTTAHALDLPGGTGAVEIDWAGVPAGGSGGTLGIPVSLVLPSLADTMPAIQAVRRMLDLDADPAQIAEAFSEDAILDPLLRRRPGARLPGARNPVEFALGVVLGQQVSLAAARTLQGRLAAGFTGSAPPVADRTVFAHAPDPELIARCDPEEVRSRLGLTRSRAETLVALATALASGLDLGPGADRGRARSALEEIRGIGPWSVELIALRALGDPDGFPAGDLILRRGLGMRTEREVRRAAEGWRPFRGYAATLLWADFLEASAADSAGPVGSAESARPKSSQGPRPGGSDPTVSR